MDKDIQKKILSEVRELKSQIRLLKSDIKVVAEQQVNSEVNKCLIGLVELKEAFPETTLKDGDKLYDVFPALGIQTLSDLSKKTRTDILHITQSYKTVYEIEEILESYDISLKSKFNKTT